MPAGPEISVATTKAYSAQLATMYCLAVQLAKVRGKIADEQYSCYISELLTIPEKMQKVDKHFVGSLAVIPLQLMGIKGLDVDKLRNLTKSVTVE